MRLKKKRRRRKQIAMMKCCGMVLVGMILCGCVVYLVHTMELHQKQLSKEEETEWENKMDTQEESEESPEMFSDTEIYTEVMVSAESEYQRISAISAGELAADGMISTELMERLFYSRGIDDVVLSRMNGKSFTQNDNIKPEELRYLKMLYYGSDGNTYVGEMIVNGKIADTVLDIFKTLYENRYPIERMVLVDEYQADDEKSMSANNTSAFNYRPIAGSSKLSRHSYGMAVDINPKYNPCVKTASDGTIVCQPENGIDYIDRSKDFQYKIDENDLAYQLFTQAGFIWGGSFNSLKDYQHFEMPE